LGAFSLICSRLTSIPIHLTLPTLVWPTNNTKAKGHIPKNESQYLKKAPELYGRLYHERVSTSTSGRKERATKEEMV
jgi:hypothetical protein